MRLNIFKGSLLASVAIGCLFVFVTSCTNENPKKDATSAKSAVKALRKLEAATQVGVDYKQYGLLLIDAQAEVNEALTALPESKLREEIRAAMDSFVDANKAWTEKLNNRRLSLEQEPGKTLIKKYNFKTGTSPNGLVVFDDEKTVEPIWAVAITHVQKVADFLGQ